MQRDSATMSNLCTPNDFQKHCLQRLIARKCQSLQSNFLYQQWVGDKKMDAGIPLESGKPACGGMEGLRSLQIYPVFLLNKLISINPKRVVIAVMDICDGIVGVGMDSQLRWREHIDIALNIITIPGISISGSCGHLDDRKTVFLHSISPFR